MCATQCVRNQLLQGPSTLDIIGQFRPSVCLSLLPVCRYQWYFQVCLPHYSLHIYFLFRLCSANANDFSKQSASYWKKKSIFSKASRLTSANIDGKQTNQCSSVNSYMKPDCGTHLPALEQSAGWCAMLHLIPHDSCNDASIGGLNCFCPRSLCHYCTF